MARTALALLLLLATACTDRDAPRPVPLPPREPVADTSRPLSSRDAPSSAVAPAADPDDPAEPGIPDLARLARYVFKTMQRHEETCPLDNPLRDRLHFALAVEVKGGRMARVGIGHVGHGGEAGGEVHPMPEAEWPRELETYVKCLAPHLGSVTMAPSPADGTYEPVYTFPGNPAGRAAH